MSEGACVEVQDDRVLVTPLTQDSWWRLESPASNSVVSARGERATLAVGLLPERAVELRGVQLGADGVEAPFRIGVKTLPPARHLVLNEVLANPFGAEPDSEWIELVNDSSRPAALGDLWLEDEAGRSALPDMTLEPHEIALLVAEGFRASPRDVPIAPGTRLIELGSLGARGLSNAGEALLLAGRDGVVARFPLYPATQAGRSVARRNLDTPDDDPRGFAEHGAPGASPGSPNGFD